MRNLKKLVALIVTIAMIATFAIPAFAAAPADVVGTDYEGAVTRLQALGVINGYPDGTFGPNDSITRAQFAAIVVRSLGYESLAATAAGVTKFSDVAANYWGAGYINLAVSLNIIKGYGDGKFGPEDKVTFDQAVTMIVRALGQEAYAETKGGFPTGYLLQAKVIGFTDGVTGVAGVATTRGVVAQLIDNAKAEDIYVQTGFGDSQTYEKDGTMLDKLGIKVQADDKIVTQTPASAGLDANTFVAGGVTYTAVAGTVDIESLLGKKVDLWGEDADNIVLAENVVGTTVAVASVDTAVVGGKVTVTLADEDATEVKYTIADGAGAILNLDVADVEDALAALKLQADAVDTQMNFVVDGDDNLLFVNGVIFTAEKKLTADPSENKVTKTIKLFTGFYIKYEDTAAKKVVIEKDGAIVDWTALKSGDILFIAGNEVDIGDTLGDNDELDGDCIYIKATDKTVTGTLQAAKDSAADAETIKVAGVWYTLADSDDVSAALGEDVTLTLDPAGNVYKWALVDDAVSADKYGVVTAVGEQDDAFGNTTYKVKIMNSDGDEVAYEVSAEDRDYAKNDLVAYHVDADGTIDAISNNATLGAVAAINTTRKTFGTTEINSNVVIFEEVGDLGTLTLSGIESGENATADYIKNADGEIVAMLLSAYTSIASDATYAYVTDFVATADGYTVDVITKDGAKSFDTTDETAADLGAVVSYQLDASGDMINVVAVDVDFDGVVTSADASKIKVDTTDPADGTADKTVWYADDAMIIYDVDEDGGTDAESLTAADMYADMAVTVYTVDGDAVLVVVTDM